MCLHKGWAYTRLEDIHKHATADNIIEMKFGFERIKVRIPDSVSEEVKRVSIPHVKEGASNPSSAYVFDFLTCYIDKDGYFRDASFKVKAVNVSRLRWLEIKTGTGRLSTNQRAIRLTCKIPVVVFRIWDVLAPAEKIWISWESDSKFVDTS